MIVTYVKGEYKINVQSKDARELIKELALCIKTLTQDLIEMDKENEHNVKVAITRDLLDVCRMPLDNPTD